MGDEADPVKLDIYARWKIAECYERENKEDHSCNDIKPQHCFHTELNKSVVKIHPRGFIRLVIEYCTELPEGVQAYRQG